MKNKSYPTPRSLQVLAIPADSTNSQSCDADFDHAAKRAASSAIPQVEVPVAARYTARTSLWNKGCTELLTIIPLALMGSESIAHEAEGRMGY